MPDIQFIEFVTRDCVYTMVEQFYLEIFKIVLEQITEKYPWTEIVSMDHVNNVQRVTIMLEDGLMSQGADTNKKIQVNDMLQNKIIEKIVLFCHVNGFQIV